ncbi:biopolymer transporter ExbD [Pseudohaliea sp.]|jgi:biopolymer transport protein ExbD|uniref:ExbD/TolR family protein n=1 Tax=Pseudohaliea sp. TaxID=2740289 RepID=UPI0032EEFB87
MRRLGKNQEADEQADIDLTPMLDVVFIMLIFFIVVASFIKEAGIEVNRPDKNQSDPSDATSILVNIRSDDQIWMENRRVDARAVRANIQRLLASDPEQAVTIKVEKGATANSVVDVADAAREAGAGAVNWASAGNR